jgi:tRNA U34 5-methylaminomethyl-2-thiouridine-forming methyltransferase MnmC
MIKNNIILPEQTTDGSTTLYLPEIDEHYHSVKGAFTEAMHVYIDLAFRHALSKKQLPEGQPLRLFEVGFGTGLNALLTLKAAHEANVKVHYTAIELYPLPEDLVEKLNYGDSDLFEKLHHASWNASQALTSNFELNKLHADLLKAKIPPADVVYFDAFAPEKQPELWTIDIFQKIYDALSPRGVLTTYCAKGAVRRALQQVGFFVERMPGPVNGKREVLRATKMI